MLAWLELCYHKPSAAWNIAAFCISCPAFLEAKVKLFLLKTENINSW